MSDARPGAEILRRDGSVFVRNRWIGSATPWSEILELDGATVSETGPGWTYVNVKDDVSAVGFYGFEGRLRHVGLVLTRLTQSWSDWSEAAEREALAVYRSLLTRIFGQASGTAGWGRWGADYDAKGGFSEIWMRYNA